LSLKSRATPTFTPGDQLADTSLVVDSPQYRTYMRWTVDCAKALLTASKALDRIAKRQNKVRSVTSMTRSPPLIFAEHCRTRARTPQDLPLKP
jgi:hypothetical protein